MGSVLRTLAFVFLALTAGCYRYVPVELGAVPPGAKVRATLSDAGIEEMRRYYGPDVTTVEGALVAWSGGELSLLRETSLRREGFPPTTSTDTVRLAPHYLTGVFGRELNGGRTAVFTLGILGVGVATVFAAQIFGGLPEEGGEGSGDDPEATVLFRIQLPIGIP